MNLTNNYTTAHFRNATERCLREIEESDYPAGITRQGEPVVVMMAARVYQELVDLVEQADTLEGLGKSIAGMGLAEPVPADELLARLRHQLELDA